MHPWQHIYRKAKRNKGFTLIELLIAITIFAVVSTAVYATFNSGMRVWRRMQEVSSAERNFLLKTEKFSRELRQTFGFAEIAFKGAKDKIEFPQVLDSQISRVTYSFAPREKTLYRSVDKLADILVAKKENTELVSKPLPYLSGNIEDIKFSYLYFDLSQNGWRWKEEWPQQLLPQAVKLEITTDKDAYQKIIPIPAG